jgi:hypothetical protein
MATDPKIILKLSEDLDNLNNIIDDMSKNIQGKLNSGLAKTSEEAKKLFDEFEKGDDLTKKIKSNLEKTQLESRKLGLQQNNLQSQLNDLLSKNNKSFVKGYAAKKLALENDIEANLQQQLLNDKTIDYIKNIERIAEKEREATKEKEKQNSLFGKIDLKKTLEPFTDFFSQAGLMALFVNAIIKADKQTTELAKSLGVSKLNAEGLRENFVQYSRATSDTFVTTDRLLKAQSDLTEQLGIAVQFSAKESETFSRLTELVGLTSTEAGNLVKFSAAAGKEIGDYEGSLLKGAFYAEQATKTHFSAKQVLQDVSKLSAGILTKFQGNPKAIAEAVVQAKALGTNLEQIDKIGESLLNWESSISNELEAELITGRQLNLEKARYAALTGTQLDLEKEIGSQVGSLADFQQMNVIAQGSLAKAFGLSRDELADMLLKQEAISKYGSKAAELNAQQLKEQQASGLSLEDYLKKQSEQRSVQEKFNQAIEKLQDIVGNLVAGPFGALLDVLSNILTVVGFIGKPFALIGYVIDQITGSAKGFASVLKGILATAAVIYTFINPIAALSSLAIAGAVIAGTEALTGKTYMATGGIVTGQLDNVTVGEAGPEAIIPLNSPKAASMLGGGGNMDMVVNAIDRLNNKIDNAMSRPAIAYINGENAFAKNLGSNKTLGSSQVQNSYNLA